MTTGVRCTLYVDGVRVADGSPGDAEDAPTALSGLSLDWGRDSTMDQPGPSTLGFDLADAPGGAAFGDVVYVGARVEVTATGTTYAEPSLPAWADPGFEAAAANVTSALNLTATRTSVRAHAGVWSTALRPNAPDRGGSLVLAPAPFAAPGTDPGAWDTLPATSPGQRWTFGASVLVPAGATVTIRPALFAGPYANAATVLDAPALVVTGDVMAPTWRVVSGTVVPNVAGAWIGLAVEVWPNGIAWDAVAAATTWDGLPAGLSWDDAGTVYLDDVTVVAPAAGIDQTVLVFAGRITDVQVAYDPSIPAPQVTCTAVDFTADLDNIDVGDAPWPAETLAARVDRILALSLPDVVADIDATVAAVMISWRDVDRQAAGGLLAELATSVDGILWSATHQVSGPYLQLEDPATRPPARVLALHGETITIVAAGADLGLSACDQEQDPVTWVQAVGDIATRAAVTWLLEGQDGDGATMTTEQTVTQVDAEREAAWGARGVSLSTQLRAEADAAAVAGRILARTGLGWRVEGVNLDDALTEPGDDPNGEVARLLALLDGTTRNGALLQLGDLPAWAPGAPTVNVYVEGGRYTYQDGRWILELVVSDAHGVGASTTWDQLPGTPAWSWDAFAADITWDDLIAVGPPT